MKVIKSRVKKITLTALIALILMGCTNVETTTVKTKYDTVYENYNEEDNTISFKDLEDVKIYYYEFDVADSKSFNFKFLQENNLAEYTSYSDALSGELYALELYNPTAYDLSKYRTYIKNNNLIEVESLIDCIYNGNYSEFVRNGINFEEQTIEVSSLRLLVASYISYNFELGNAMQNKNMR